MIVTDQEQTVKIMKENMNMKGIQELGQTTLFLLIQVLQIIIFNLPF